MATELGPIIDIDQANIVGPYEAVGLGLDANLGNIYNSSGPTGLTGDHTTLATAYTTGQTTGTSNIIRRIRGFRMPPKVKSVFYYPFRIPSGALAGALTSGVTFELLLAMDPNVFDADTHAESGSITNRAYFDVCGIKINSATQTYGSTTVTPDDFVLGTVTCVANATTALPTTPGCFHVHNLAATNACLSTPAVGEWIFVRIRRLGDHQLDTNAGFISIVAISGFAY